MPRLTNHDYLINHHVLADYWLYHEFIYATLSASEQWDLHTYFVPYKYLTQAELIEHRKAITIECPSLPQKAGRALARLKRNLDLVQQVRRRTGQEVLRRGGNAELPVTIYPLVNPEIDVKRLARALIALAEHQLKGRRAQAEETEAQKSAT